MNAASRLFPILVVSALLVACAQSTDTEATRATPIRVSAATLGPAAPVIRTNGMLVNKDELRLSFKVAGVVSRINVQ
jgi:multidrug efflux pump subunit AcrA (membrane-fusion protein)